MRSLKRSIRTGLNKVRGRFIKRYNIKELNSKDSIHRMTVFNVISQL